MDPATQRKHTERNDTLLSSGQFRPAAARDSSDPRSSAPTLAVAGTAELARNIDRVQDQIEREDSGSPISIRPIPDNRHHPEWCVDLGSILKPMTTFELWIALGNGSVASEALVWRDGMDRWRPARFVPELMHALPDLSSCDTSAGEATGTPPPAVRERSPSEITPVERTRTHDVSESEPDVNRQASGIRATLRTASYQSGFFAVAVGAAIGVGALLFALISTHRARPAGWLAASPSPPAVHLFSSHARALTARAEEWAARSAVEVDLDPAGEELVLPELDGPAHRPSLSARHRDPGQSRARRGSQP